MKNALIFTVIGLLSLTSAHAETTATDDETQNLAQLRKKIVQVKKEMDYLMKDLQSSDTAGGDIFSFGSDVKVDITQDEKNIYVLADLPGMDKEKIDITLENNRVLHIAGMREVITEDKTSGVIRKERMSGKFERTFQLPVECKSEGIQANYKAGVLSITIPKAESAATSAVHVPIK